MLSEVTRQGERVATVHLEDLSPNVVAAVLAAEDARFFEHHGVDPLAVGRAAWQALRAGKLVSGASTITQQLARSLFARPRTLVGKWKEWVVALRIERELSKHAILEAYLNHIEFGPRIRGLEAASRLLLDKPASQLDLAEAALLVGLPRGPTLYDPRRRPDLAQKRRNRILERMRAKGSLSTEVIDRALAQPFSLHKPYRAGTALHLARALAREEGSTGTVRTTLSGDLQGEIEALTSLTVERLRRQDATAAAVLVVNNASREVLAYVGSPDFWSDVHLGQNDGVRALRQPGSALKPFVYAAALRDNQFTAASLLPDVEIHLPTPRGDYSPQNYDGVFHGPVRLRTALASSLNVPAVYAAQRTGPETVLSLLRQVGFSSLTKNAGEYGAAIALGDGEVTLAELATAYVTLANGGLYAPLRYVRDVGSTVTSDPSIQRVLDPPLSQLLTHILADDHERQLGFGRGSALQFPFPVAAKTGTSKGYRDNWAVGFSSAITVAVWVGNFDGRPMRQSSGVTGAGPLFHAAMLAAMRGRASAPVATEVGLAQSEICGLSGALATATCPHKTRELFLPGTTPSRSCEMHESVLVAPDSGLRATEDCPGAVPRVFERYPEMFSAWAAKAQRPLAPERFDPRCPGSVAAAGGPPRVGYPFDGARFSRDPGISDAQQRIVLRAQGATVGPLWFLLDGERIAANHRGELPWPLEPGTHSLAAESNKGRGPSVRFSVD